MPARKFPRKTTVSRNILTDWKNQLAAAGVTATVSNYSSRSYRVGKSNMKFTEAIALSAIRRNGNAVVVIKTPDHLQGRRVEELVESGDFQVPATVNGDVHLKVSLYVSQRRWPRSKSAPAQG